MSSDQNNRDDHADLAKDQLQNDQSTADKLDSVGDQKVLVKAKQEVSLVTEKQLSSGSKPNASSQQNSAKEINGPKGLEPTRYGDWESKGRCHDF